MMFTKAQKGTKHTVPINELSYEGGGEGKEGYLCSYRPVLESMKLRHHFTWWVGLDDL